MAYKKSLLDPSLSDGEKISILSKHVDHLSRRTVKKTSAMISPVSISN